MDILEIVSLALGVIFLVSSLLMFLLLVYIGRRRVKQVDLAVLGYELPTDVFSLFLRVPNYAGAFSSRFFARRVKLAGKIEHFDRRFRWPFVVIHWLVVTGLCAMIVGVFIEKHLGRM